MGVDNMKLVFRDESRQRNQGVLTLEVPDPFGESIGLLMTKLKFCKDVHSASLGNMAAFLHVRLSFYTDPQLQYILGWRKPKDATKALSQLEKTFYINKHSLEELGVIPFDKHDEVIQLLKNGGFSFAKTRDDDDNVSLFNVDLDTQAEIINYISAKLP